MCQKHERHLQEMQSTINISQQHNAAQGMAMLSIRMQVNHPSSHEGLTQSNDLRQYTTAVSCQNVLEASLFLPICMVLNHAESCQVVTGRLAWP